MARLPYPFKGAPRFVVDSEGAITDKRREFLQYVISSMFTESLMLWGTGGYKPSQDFWIPEGRRPASEAADAFECAVKPRPTLVTMDEASNFDQEALDNLIAEQLKTKQQERERLVFEEQRYTGNPDCLLGISGCNCGLPRGWDER